MTGRWHKVGHLGVKPKQLSPSQHPRITYSSSSAAAYYSPALHPGLTRPHLVPCDCPMVCSLCPGLWALKPAQVPKPTAQQPQPCSSSKGQPVLPGRVQRSPLGAGSRVEGTHLGDTNQGGLTTIPNPQWLAGPFRPSLVAQKNQPAPPPGLLQGLQAPTPKDKSQALATLRPPPFQPP